MELGDGINLDTTPNDRIVGIEILNASKRLDLKTLLTYSVEFEKKLVPEDNS